MDEVRYRYPDFLCIGAQKAGTTWLHSILTRHPRIWLPQVKELQFFNQLYIPSHRHWIPKHRSEHAARAREALAARVASGGMVEPRSFAELELLSSSEASDEWYGRIFAFAGEDQIAGEFTPEYALLPEEGIGHVLRLNPAMKIVFLVRDPIDRAWSHLRMLIGRRSMDDAALAAMARLPDILDRCDYSSIMRRWLSLVPREQFLLLNYDDIGREPILPVTLTCDFLGVEGLDVPAGVLGQKVHVGVGLDMPTVVYEELRTALEPVYMSPLPALEPAFAPWRAHHYGVASAPAA